MRSGFVVDILTPKRVQLNGIWLGPRRAKRVIIWVHGLGSSLFSKLDLADALIDKDTAVFAFNNRGHDKVARITRGKKRITGGAAHEVFTDCVDDIEGAISAVKKAGAKEIFLAGHSTGCQKSVYWAAKKGTGVKGIILLAPISDYSAEAMISGTAKLAKGLKIARTMIRNGKAHELMPSDSMEWALVCDAQRFVSLYSGESAEEIFPYWHPARMPTTLKKVKLPVLVCLAREDQYNDRPAPEMAAWFEKHLRSWKGTIIVNNVDHSFHGGEEIVARHIRGFINEVGTKQ